MCAKMRALLPVDTWAGGRRPHRLGRGTWHTPGDAALAVAIQPPLRCRRVQQRTGAGPTRPRMDERSPPSGESHA
jgi:hypothetical protein